MVWEALSSSSVVVSSSSSYISPSFVVILSLLIRDVVKLRRRTGTRRVEVAQTQPVPPAMKIGRHVTAVCDD